MFGTWDQVFCLLMVGEGSWTSVPAIWPYIVYKGEREFGISLLLVVKEYWMSDLVYCYNVHDQYWSVTTKFGHGNATGGHVRATNICNKPLNVMTGGKKSSNLVTINKEGSTSFSCNNKVHNIAAYNYNGWVCGTVNCKLLSRICSHLI